LLPNRLAFPWRKTTNTRAPACRSRSSGRNRGPRSKWTKTNVPDASTPYESPWASRQCQASTPHHVPSGCEGWSDDQATMFGITCCASRLRVSTSLPKMVQTKYWKPTSTSACIRLIARQALSLPRFAPWRAGASWETDPASPEWPQGSRPELVG
jgi:hypothetical protein